ncbi:Alcohol dehydrogenase NADP(+) [Porphyridium purpureum]|uniref:Alcohol dehydrogenase NADP(+) n=1 Tax=Porphyridium purpureum TaxID=35688 RepID=A0A5J4YQ78_PORPP|nr:Alcohol dehydrogenase NADP(+) [Porphyridium purpureum]|eukprot:POR7964..scf295_9
MECVTLVGGQSMPMVGLGTWKSASEQVERVVCAAIRNGYRLIDCANDYGNEAAVGRAIARMVAEGVVTRDELFVQVKLWNTNHRREHVREDLLASLHDLQLTYVDSFVIHWPQACPATGECSATFAKHGTQPENSIHTMFPLDENGCYRADKQSHYVETWHAMEALVDEGLARTIGLSNFNAKQVKEILLNVRKHRPAVLQNECHPFLQQRDLLDLCKGQNIVLQAYSPLGSGDRPWLRQPSDPELLQDQAIVRIAERHGKTPAQVVLRWQLERGVSVVPKTVNEGRLVENFNVCDFRLSDDDMREFNKLNIGWRYLLWPETSAHPDYPFKDELPWDYELDRAPLNTSKSVTM